MKHDFTTSEGIDSMNAAELPFHFGKRDDEDNFESCYASAYV